MNCLRMSPGTLRKPGAILRKCSAQAFRSIEGGRRYCTIAVIIGSAPFKSFSDSHSRESSERPDERNARFHSVQPGVDEGAPAFFPGSIARRQHTSAPGTDTMTRVPLSGSTKSLVVVPSRGAQSGAPVITASTCALSKLKLLSVKRPGSGGPKSHTTGAGAAATVGGGGGAATATGGGGIAKGGGAISATGGGTGAGTAAAAGGGAAISAGGGGHAHEAVAISKAETIRMRTRSPLLSPLPRPGRRGSFPVAARGALVASFPAEEVPGPLPVIRAARDLLHQLR